MATKKKRQQPLPGTNGRSTGAVTARSSASAKVRLFRDLVRGRSELYPKLWVNQRKGKKGYAPACSNEWVHGVCEKPRVRCGSCPRQAFIPVTDSTEPLPVSELDAMIDDVLVDAFTRHDQAIAFFEMLDDQLERPFSATAGKAVVSVESLAVNDRAQVIAHCSTEAGRQRRIPLTRLVPHRHVPLGWEWAEAHHRWVKLGRQERQGE